MLILHCFLGTQSKEEMGGTGTTDLKAAAQGLRLPSPNTALAPPPGVPSAFQAPKNEDWRSKFRSSDSFTSDRGTPVSCCTQCSAVDICCVCCWRSMLAFADGAGCVFCFWRSAVGICCGVASDAQVLIFVTCGCQPANVCMSLLHLIWFILVWFILIWFILVWFILVWFILGKSKQ